MDKRLLYSLIACHGITDLSTSTWGPIYTLCFLISLCVNYHLLLFTTIVLSLQHFSEDIGYHDIRIKLVYLGVFLYLLKWYKSPWSKNLVLQYLGWIHTPINLYRSSTPINNLRVAIVFFTIYSQPLIGEYIDWILMDLGIIQDVRLNRILLGILIAHMLV
jgi:hypothetical protein